MKISIGDEVKIKATVVDFNESYKTVKLRIEGLSEDNRIPTERYIRMNDDTLSNIKEDILCKLDNAVNPGLDEKTLKEIIDIKDTGLNKQSPEQVSDEK